LQRFLLNEWSVKNKLNMPRTKEQNMVIREERKQSIMDAALLLFAEDGFVHTSIDRIAQQAGISKGLLYSYFKNKDDLLYQILVSGIRQFSDSFSPAMTLADFVTGLAKSFDNIQENSAFFKLYSLLSFQPQVLKNLGPLADEYEAFRNMVKLFEEQFGDRALEELLLISVISKGFSILTLFGDHQHVVPVDKLKKTIIDFIRERYLV
jgi:AcrR family transcriptional regulator